MLEDGAAAPTGRDEVKGCSMNVRKAVGEHLRLRPNGETCTEISKAINARVESVRAALKVMPHVYIDRFKAVRNGHRYRWAAVFVLADIPESAPMPDREPTVEDFLLSRE